ncbi:MAG TPA: hypothetical protein VIY08_01655 [Candidatus Nitrosocosmicus sp.]
MKVITYEYTKGKINNEQHENLKKELSIKYEDVYNKRIDHLDYLAIPEKEKQINHLQDEIEEAYYSKEKITESQYNLLQKRLANLK